MIRQPEPDLVPFKCTEGVYEGGGLRISWADERRSYEYEVFVDELDHASRVAIWRHDGRIILTTTDRQKSCLVLGPLRLELDTTVIANQHGHKVSCSMAADLPQEVASSLRVKPLVAQGNKKKGKKRR